MGNDSESFLGIDLGTSTVKVLITAADGEVLGRGEAGYPITSPVYGQAEQDPDSWWAACIQAVNQASKNTGAGRKRIACIGLTGQMHGTVLLDKHGNDIAPAIIWPDQRSTDQATEINDLVGREQLVHLTGSPAAAGFQAATIRWFQQKQPRTWALVDKVLLPKDYLRWRLTGEQRTDASDASGTLLFNINRRQWSVRLLDLFGIKRSQLPEVIPSAGIAGRLNSEAANALGLPVNTPVVNGAGDVACGLLGAGVTSVDKLMLTISTGGQIALPVSAPDVDLLGRIHTYCSAIEPAEGNLGYLQLGAILSAGRSLRWLRDQILSGSRRLSYEQITAWANEVPPGSGGLLYLPYIAGERTPHMDAAARGMFLGLTIEHGYKDLVRAVMEGVVLACYDAFSIVVELGARPERIIMAGGGARSHLWRQIVADVFNLPVQSPRVTEQAAMGAAILAASGTGLFLAVQAAEEFTSYDGEVKPDAGRHDRYQQMFDVYRSAYQAVQIMPANAEKEKRP